MTSLPRAVLAKARLPWADSDTPLALLLRQSRPFRLTTHGKELAQAARPFFQSVDDLQKRAGDEAQRVVIGAGETLMQWLLFPACEATQKQTGGLVFAFKSLDSARLVEGLQQGEVDVALIRKEEVTPSLMHAGDWRYAHVALVPKGAVSHHMRACGGHA